MKELLGWALFAIGGLGLFAGLIISLINYALSEWDGSNLIIWTFLSSTFSFLLGVTLIFVNDKIETRRENKRG